MSKTLLLADDSVVIQKLVGLSFANEDVDLITTDNGDDAVARALETKPDLVLADVVMPGKSGYEVCEAIKQNPELSHIPVLLLTGTFEAFDEERARQAGSDGHITKPFEAQALVARVVELLEAAPSPASASVASKPAAEAVAGSADSFEFFDDDVADLSAQRAPDPSAEEVFSFGEPLDVGAGGDRTIALMPDVPSDLATPGDLLSEPPGDAAGGSLGDTPVPDAVATVLADDVFANPDPAATVLADEMFATSDPIDPVDSLDYAATAGSPGGPTTEPLLASSAPIDSEPELSQQDTDSVTDPAGSAGSAGSAFGSASGSADRFAGEAVAELESAAHASPLPPDATLLADDLFGEEPPVTGEPIEVLSEADAFAFGLADSPAEPAVPTFSEGPLSLATPEADALLSPPAMAADFDVSSSDLEDPLGATDSVHSTSSETPAVPQELTPRPVEASSEASVEAPMSVLAEEPSVAGSGSDATPQVPDLTPVMRDQIHETLEKIAWEAFSDVSESIVRQVMERVEKIAWEVIPQMAEAMVREEIRRMKGEE